MIPLILKEALAPLPAQPGDFIACVVGCDLVLPSDVFTAFRSFGARTAVDMVSYAENFPSAVSAALQWTVDQTRQAAATLKGQLKGLVDDDILDPPPRPQVVYDAMPPEPSGRR